MADGRREAYLTAMGADNRSFLRRAAVEVLAETVRGGFIGAGMAGTIAPLRIPLMLFGAGATGGYEVYKQVSSALAGTTQTVPASASSPGRNARIGSAAFITGGFSLAGDLAAKAFGVPYTFRQIGGSAAIAAAAGAGGEIAASGIRDIDRIVAQRGGYLAVMQAAARGASSFGVQDVGNAAGTAIMMARNAIRSIGEGALGAADVRSQERPQPRMNLMGPVDARTVAVSEARNTQASALQARRTARTRGERDAARDASRQFRGAVLAARAQTWSAGTADRLPPLQQQWRRTRDGHTHIVRRQTFWR